MEEIVTIPLFWNKNVPELQNNVILCLGSVQLRERLEVPNPDSVLFQLFTR